MRKQQKYEVIYNDGNKQHKEVVNEQTVPAVINKIKINRWNLERCQKVKGGKKNV